MKIDAGLGANLAKLAERAAAAEGAGADCLWAAETVNDPFLSLALAAEHSQHASLGTAIAIAFARNPMEAARQAGAERKHTFILHVSGNFEEARFT